MPSDGFLKGMNAVHRVIMAVTGGRAGWQFGTMPVVELTTIGRKSGEKRTVLLTSPVQEGDDVVIVASRGGDDHHPAWYLNLVANPRVEARVKGGPWTPMIARTATPEERTRWWPSAEAAYKGYRSYQQRTSREIPLVVLSPVR
jgi:deazaflavin-dependent oxidoreductase (nitroreductase family)